MTAQPVPPKGPVGDAGSARAFATTGNAPCDPAKSPPGEKILIVEDDVSLGNFSVVRSSSSSFLSKSRSMARPPGKPCRTPSTTW